MGVQPCCVPGCRDPLGGRVGRKAVKRLSLARLGLSGLACERCYTRVKNRVAAGLGPADALAAGSRAGRRAAGTDGTCDLCGRPGCRRVPGGPWGLAGEVCGGCVKEIVAKAARLAREAKDRAMEAEFGPAVEAATEARAARGRAPARTRWDRLGPDEAAREIVRLFDKRDVAGLTAGAVVVA